ncbi:MAG: acyl carrier protein [Lachnospiraceae bacterium]|nr:acyl carrier protein [Lachnospiraceae bacterium]
MYCKWIIEWFIKQGVSNEEELYLNMDSDFFEKGYIDSFLFIRLISDIEENFKISFDNEQFEDKKFSTIAGMGKCIELCINKSK